MFALRFCAPIFTSPCAVNLFSQHDFTGRFVRIHRLVATRFFGRAVVVGTQTAEQNRVCPHVFCPDNRRLFAGGCALNPRTPSFFKTKLLARDTGFHGVPPPDNVVRKRLDFDRKKRGGAFACPPVFWFSMFPDNFTLLKTFDKRFERAGNQVQFSSQTITRFPNAFDRNTECFGDFLVRELQFN